MIRTNFLVEKGIVWWKRRFSLPEVFSFHSSFSNPESVLVCFPARSEEFASAANHLPGVVDIFPSSRICLLLPLLGAQDFAFNLKSHEIILPRSGDMKLFSLPNRSFIERIRKYNFGITLDLDMKGCFFNAMTCLASHSPLRIGLGGKWGKPFYNIELAPQKGLVYLDQKYDAILEILKNLGSRLTK